MVEARTFLDNFSNEHFGETCHDLGDGLGDLLAERLLDDLEDYEFEHYNERVM
jgi:hypothetical protein